MSKTICALAIGMLLSGPVLASDPYKAGDQIFRFTYSYGSSEAIPGTAITYAVTQTPIEPPPVIPPPVICNQKPKKFDCPHASSHGESGGTEYTDRAFLGMAYSYFLADDLAFDGGIFWPTGDPGASTFSANAGLDYYFGSFFIPIQAGYLGQTDGFYGATGGGYDWVVRQSKAVVRLTGTVDFLEEGEVGWTSQFSAGWKF